ncbi:MAG: hypothetical protein NC338_01565 [Firmicutes bacterium]|nr:hypothetical protein [Bacillota bacterium]MCM1401079.1 hypothetical protein [Bacteroides sp.]MCM1476998.1 hypothetical protein [Bacteroides sp.]
MPLSARSRNFIFLGLTILVVAYLVVAWFFTAKASQQRLCQGVLITVHDTSEIHFVTPQELSAELGDLPRTALFTPLASINIDSIEHSLNLFDKIERVNVNILNSGKILVDVWPMRPVARIFDSSGHSYYINRAGKRIAAAPGYFLDVPVIRGDFSELFPATSLIPLIDFIEADPDWREAISMIDVRSPSDIMLIPVIRGHVINFGDTTDFADKFKRLKLMYSKVMSAKGWDFYKEISVKWRGQVVGIRRNAKAVGPEYLLDEENDEETTVSTAELDEGLNSRVRSEKPLPFEKMQKQASAPATDKPVEKKKDSGQADTARSSKPKIKNKTT